MSDENIAHFKVSGKISLGIIIVLITFILSLGSTIANSIALEKRITVLEQKEEKACVVINDLLIVNAKIGENLIYIKDTLKEINRGGK